MTSASTPEPYRHPRLSDAQAERVAALLRPYAAQLAAPIPDSPADEKPASTA